MPARSLTATSTPVAHSFTLVVEGLDVSSDAHIDALHQAGCDDATFGVRDGAAYAIFDREAASFSDALRGAIADISRALPWARIVRVESDGFGRTIAPFSARSSKTATRPGLSSRQI